MASSVVANQVALVLAWVEVAFPTNRKKNLTV